MKTIIFGLIGGITLVFGMWAQSQSQQEQAKAQIKKQRRDERYHSETSNTKLLKPGEKEASFVDLVDMTGYDQKAPLAERNAVADRLAAEHKQKRTEVGCQADAILFGRIGQPTGHVTTDRSYIYTSYTLTIQDIIKAPPSVTLTSGSEIELTVPGGKAKHPDGGGWIEVQDPNFNQLIPLKDHILLLKYDKETDDYYVFDPIGIYKILSDGTIVRGDAKHFELAREARLAREPDTFDAVMTDLKSLKCSKK